MNNIGEELHKKYDLLINTLKMCGTDSEGLSNEEIEEYLEELEGDYYTFFHVSNLETLRDGGLLNESQVRDILELRCKIDAIDPSLWNKEAFTADLKWNEIRMLSKSILSTCNCS